jgi:hypothetical protein
MIDLKTETPISLAAAARLFPPGRRGRPLTISWITDGVRAPGGERIRLEAARAGGRWITTTEAVQRFIERQTPNLDRDKPLPPRSPHKRQRAPEKAALELERAGI